ncbi:methyltransferase family protein [Chitinophaga vietnamensis]|uniref:methyltransferase family protein n=1 Tax=Chitinophaga vietnamensis TaxID=2593957 RepID=UPI001375DFC1|nr:isoprenylcysteine carboxylmethyltransferase family protein [Chitinophaga vietnamensis]
MAVIGTKTYRGVVKSIIVLGLLLFIPAGTLRYWPGWIYFIINAINIWLLTYYFLKHDPALLQRRVNSGPRHEKEKSQRLIQSVNGALIILLYICSALEYRWYPHVIPMYIVIMGNLLVLLSYYLVFVVFKTNSFASATIEVSGNQQVINTGPYRLVRHPMYSGALLMFLAIPLALGVWRTLLFSILLIGGLAWRLLDEERFLRTHLNGYTAYCQQTRYRLIPGVW